MWFYPKPIDFRKQIDGLIVLIASHLEKSPVSGQLFLFRNRSSNKLKMLWFDRNSFWLFYNRLEAGRFIFPPLGEAAVTLSRDQLSWLLSGLDCSRPPVFSEIKPTHFY